MIAYRSQESYFWFFLLVVVIENAALANYLEIGHEAALLELWDCNHAYLEYFLNYSRYSECRDLYFASVLHKMVKVVNITNLTRYCYTFCILRSNFPIIYKGIVCCFTKLAVNQITANHHSSSTFACFAVDCSNIFWVFRQKIMQVLTEIDHQHKNRWMVIIKSVVLRATVE